VTGPGWPDARGWIGLGSFLLTVLVLVMLATVPALRSDEFFKTIATLIIGTGFVNGVVNWAYGATKGGGELADNNAAIVRKQAENSPPISEERP
jgi:hypothetical protein